MEAIQAEIAAITAKSTNYNYKTVSEGGKQLKPGILQEVSRLRERQRDLRKELCA